MSTRRYSEAEVAAIFQRATEAQPTGVTPDLSGEGMTLAQLQDIGREVGIPPESIALAARSVGQEPVPAPRRLLGLPYTAARTVYLDRKLTEDEWERVVVDLRETFNARGNVSSQGSLRQWTNGNLQALLEPTPTGHRIRLRTTKSAARVGMPAGLVLMALSAAGLIGGMLQGDATVFAPMGFGALAGGVLFARHAIGLPRWAKTRERQMEEVAGRIEELGNRKEG